MIILTIRTEKPEAELGLYDDNQQLKYETWTAHRQLAESLHAKIAELLESDGKTWQDIQGIVGYKGPGSFTGLRIGLSVANALASSLQIPIVSGSDDWIEHGINRLLNGETEKVALPEYGAAALTTTPRK